MSIVDDVLTLPADRVVALIHQNATWAWAYEQFLIAQTTGQIAILGGIGLDEQMMIMGDPETDGAVYQRIKFARSVACKLWRGLNVQHLQQQQGLEFHQLDVFAALESGARHLTQALIDFLTLRAEVDEEAWGALYSTRSMPFDRPDSGRIAVKAINHYGDEVLKVYSL